MAPSTDTDSTTDMDNTCLPEMGHHDPQMGLGAHFCFPKTLKGAPWHIICFHGHCWTSWILLPPFSQKIVAADRECDASGLPKVSALGLPMLLLHRFGDLARLDNNTWYDDCHKISDLHLMILRWVPILTCRSLLALLLLQVWLIRLGAFPLVLPFPPPFEFLFGLLEGARPLLPHCQSILCVFPQRSNTRWFIVQSRPTAETSHDSMNKLLSSNLTDFLRLDFRKIHFLIGRL